MGDIAAESYTGQYNHELGKDRYEQDTENLLGCCLGDLDLRSDGVAVVARVACTPIVRAMV